ncbi:MAG: hypothetical protein LBC20_14440 [Planctomycetaceae bacterium]|nr:hypothetical protein [Planctomycetaceae bacterium]
MPKKTTKKVKKTTKTTSTRAGRPKGSGKFGCITKAIRIPIHLENEVQLFIRRKLKAEGNTVK